MDYVSRPADEESEQAPHRHALRRNVPPCVLISLLTLFPSLVCIIEYVLYVSISLSAYSNVFSIVSVCSSTILSLFSVDSESIMCSSSFGISIPSWFGIFHYYILGLDIYFLLKYCSQSLLFPI